jgi:hypothetical protein
MKLKIEEKFMLVTKTSSKKALKLRRFSDESVFSGNSAAAALSCQ